MGDEGTTSVYEHLFAALDALSAVAWQKMGLRTDALSGKIVRNIDEARIAIDAVAALAALLEPALDASDRNRLQGLVRDLRLNFVTQSKDATR